MGSFYSAMCTTSLKSTTMYLYTDNSNMSQRTYHPRDLYIKPFLDLSLSTVLLFIPPDINNVCNTLSVNTISPRFTNIIPKTHIHTLHYKCCCLSFHHVYTIVVIWYRIQWDCGLHSRSSLGSVQSNTSKSMWTMIRVKIDHHSVLTGDDTPFFPCSRVTNAGNSAYCSFRYNLLIFCQT